MNIVIEGKAISTNGETSVSETWLFRSALVVRKNIDIKVYVNYNNNRGVFCVFR